MCVDLQSAAKDHRPTKLCCQRNLKAVKHQMECSVAKGEKKKKIRKTEKENNRRPSLIYCRFIESLARLVFFLKNLGSGCFRHCAFGGAGEEAVLCFCSDGGSRSWGLRCCQERRLVPGP